jgi:hypothetical protein
MPPMRKYRWVYDADRQIALGRRRLERLAGYGGSFHRGVKQLGTRNPWQLRGVRAPAVA